MLVFVFLPPLVHIPGWLFFEATNPLNLREPVVLSFLLVRGVNRLLNAFFDGVVAGVLAGAIDGVLVCGWLSCGAPASTRREQIILGATTGALAVCLMVLLVMAFEAFEAQQRGWGASAVAFEIVAGLACGIVAAPGAIRFLSRGDRYRPCSSVPASQ